MGDRKQALKAYTELARAIRTMELKGRLNDKEMLALLGLLDAVNGDEYRELQELLDQYLSLPPDREADEIARATLVGGSLDDGLGEIMTVLAGLMAEKQRAADNH